MPPIGKMNLAPPVGVGNLVPSPASNLMVNLAPPVAVCDPTSWCGEFASPTPLFWCGRSGGTSWCGDQKDGQNQVSMLECVSYLGTTYTWVDTVLVLVL